MPTIENISTIKEVKSVVGSSLREGYPSSFSSNPVQLVANVNPKDYKFIDATKSATSSTSTTPVSLFTTSATRDTYIVGAQMSVVKDATCDAATGQVTLNAIIGGVSSSRILSIPHITLVALSMTSFISLPIPLKVDRNTSVSIASQTFTVGTMARSAIVYIYEVEPNEL